MNLVSKLIVAASILASNMLAAQPYKPYKADFGPMKAVPGAFEKWQALTKKGNAEGMNKDLVLEKSQIVKPILAKNPDWVDGYWLYANMMMIYGETQSSSDKEGMKRTRGYLVEAMEHADKCLKKDKTVMICRFFYGAAVGKIATIDGIISSVSKGKTVINSWIEVYNSDQDYVFDDGSSLQGLVRYAMGIYYRVVPDFFLLRWIFGISGDIDKSVKMHRESLAYEGLNEPCPKLMLAAAMLCKSDAEPKSKLSQEANKLLSAIEKANKNVGESTLVCIEDASMLKVKPDNACGYTKAQVQKRDEASLKAHTAPESK